MEICIFNIFYLLADFSLSIFSAVFVISSGNILKPLSDDYGILLLVSVKCIFPYELRFSWFLIN